MKSKVLFAAVSLSFVLVAIAVTGILMGNGSDENNDRKIQTLIDTVVTLEENAQRNNLTELFLGNAKRADVEELLHCTTRSSLMGKAKKTLQAIDKIDKITAKQILFIDGLKKDLLAQCGENLATDHKYTIITRDWEKRLPLKPTRFNFRLLENKSDDTTPTQVLGIVDYKKPEGKGLQLWTEMMSFRKEIVQTIAKTHVITDENNLDSFTFDERYHLYAPEINKYRDYSDLVRQIENVLDTSSVHMDDLQPIIDIYASLTHLEYSTIGNTEGVHWIGRTFYRQTLIGALAALTTLQSDVLRARAQAVSVIRSRIGFCC